MSSYNSRCTNHQIVVSGTARTSRSKDKITVTASNPLLRTNAIGLAVSQDSTKCLVLVNLDYTPPNGVANLSGQTYAYVGPDALGQPNPARGKLVADMLASGPPAGLLLASLQTQP